MTEEQQDKQPQSVSLETLQQRYQIASADAGEAAIMKREFAERAAAAEEKYQNASGRLEELIALIQMIKGAASPQEEKGE